MAAQAQVTQLVDRMGRDSDFASALEADSLSTLRDSGLDELHSAAERERDHVAELVDRIYRDEEFRHTLEQSPRTVLDDWGIPEAAFESVLMVAGAPEEVLERVADDVEAHGWGRKPLGLAAAAAVLGAFAFAQEAGAANRPDATAEVTSAAVVAQVSPEQTRAEISPELSGALQKAQVSHAAWKAQVSHPALKWQGVNMQRLSAQHLAAILHVQ